MPERPVATLQGPLVEIYIDEETQELSARIKRAELRKLLRRIRSIVHSLLANTDADEYPTDEGPKTFSYLTTEQKLKLINLLVEDGTGGRVRLMKSVPPEILDRFFPDS